MRFLTRIGNIEHVLDVEEKDLEPGLYYRSSDKVFYPENLILPWRRAENGKEGLILVGPHIQFRELGKNSERQSGRK